MVPFSRGYARKFRTIFMPKPTVSGQEQLLSPLRIAPNRLEYLTPNDWALLIDRAEEVSFQKDEILIQKGRQAKMICFARRHCEDRS